MSAAWAGTGLAPLRAIETANASPRAVQILKVLGLLFLFLLGIRALGGGFGLLGNSAVDGVFAATSDPLVGLAVGILTTSLVQSSSVTTALIVGLVAAPHSPLSVAQAIPMVMGANIGTSVTNTVVSLGHIRRPEEFKRAFAAATCHDFFNWMAVAILLPLELTTGLLEKTSRFLVDFIPSGAVSEFPNPVKAAATFFLEPLETGLAAALPATAAALVLIAIAALIIFFSLSHLVGSLRALVGARVGRSVESAIDERPITGMAIGCAATAMVQSSSVTTSMLVPLAGAGVVSLSQLFPITLGANVGTTMTALVAAAGASAETFQLGVQIALVHLLFNLLGILLIYPIRSIREIPLQLARWLADVAARSKWAAAAYVIGIFFVLPAALALL